MAKSVYLARQPIVDGNHHLYAYELMFRDAAHAQTARIDDTVSASLDIICNALCNMGTEWLLKGKLAFINMDAQLLLSDFPSLLPTDKVVIEVLETVPATPKILERLASLRQAGFRIALDDYEYTSDRAPLLDLADYVKIDIQTHTHKTIQAILKLLQSHRLQLVAEKVETHEQFKLSKQLGFKYFQGYYFARPENITAKVINPTQATVIRLIDKVRREADVKEIEVEFKRDVALTFKLLHYINSVGFGFSCEIQSIRHAVSILGYRSLYKWLTLLLATASPSPMAPVLARTAVTRGRLCELLGAFNLPKTELDNLFITGVFSLLDALLETPLEQVLERITLPLGVADALLSRSGLYGPILDLAIACETGDADRIDVLANALLLSPEQVNRCHLEALTWVEQVWLD